MRIQFTRITLLLTTALALLTTITEAQTLPNWLPSNGLVAYYPFNGDAGDSSGNQLHGALLGGITFTTGRNGQPNTAASFNGTTTYIEVQDDPKLRFRNGTVIYWIRTTSVTKQTIIAKSNVQSSSNEMYASTINDPNSGEVIFGVKYNSNCQAGSGWRFNSSFVNVNDGQWQMIAFTIRPDSLIIYKNGIKINAVTSNASLIDSCVGGTLRIGRNWASDNRYFNGSLDDIALYNRPLSELELSKIYLGCPIAPTINVIGQTSICAGDTIALVSSSQFGNTWSNGDTNRIIRVTQAGTYFTSLTNAGCTTNSLPVTISVTPRPATPIITPSGTTTFCSGGAVVLNSSVSTGNVWSNSSTNSTITVTTSGIYTVTVSNGQCSSTSSPIIVTVNPNPPTPTINVGGPTTFCQGGSVVLTSSSLTGNLWSNNSNTQSITITQSGTYSVTVALGNCTSTSNSITVNVLPGVTITNQPANQTGFVLSNARFVVATNNSANNSYQWQTNIGFGFQNISNAGQYSGANNDTLEISNLSISNNNQLFRCIITRGTCADTSNEATLLVTTGVSSSNLYSNKIEVYPNPSTSFVSINIGSQFETIAYDLINVDGKLVKSGLLNNGLNIISLEEIPVGIYLLKTSNLGWTKIIRK